MRSAVRSDINITPLIDIVLVLLIVFITMVPALVKGHTPRIPAISTGASTSGVAPLELALAADGSLALGKRAVSSEGLEALLRQALAERAPQDRKLVVKVDGDASLQRSVDLLDRIHVMDPKLPVVLR
ncbi:MAG TPA: biopolymer transporter ExbD [Holophagaceae bacterium]|nr:biopolymer transporter ExbD [Holophagaceae bacterium]